MANPRVFISYSHADRKWLERLQVHLRPLIRDSIADIWDDSRIRAGDDWRIEIGKALEAASVAVLLVSADFLASDFVQSEELPVLLKAAEARGLLILQLIVSPSRFERTPLAQLQAVNSPAEPLVNMNEYQRELLLETLAARIESAVQTGDMQAQINSAHNRIDHQASQIETLITYFMSSSIFNHLCGIALLREYIYHHDPGNQREFYFLRDTGLIQPKPGIPFLDFGEGSPWNVAAVAEPTPVGWMYVRLRRQDIPKNMLEDIKNLRLDPTSLQ
jgi:TIR domain